MVNIAQSYGGTPVVFLVIAPAVRIWEQKTDYNTSCIRICKDDDQRTDLCRVVQLLFDGRKPGTSKYSGKEHNEN
ncbi:hypothetical protein HDU92_009090 [Lobulomyces angularis]|nr:hypothetical protein HDU92_009090 [Lobulomyces angularis]